VEKAMAEAAPELVLGTQMERHSAKRLGLPCAVISSPLHVQDVPARYSPQMGWEGANVIFDSWVHPLMMGLEEHLIGMFRHDFEFVDGHLSHLEGASAPAAAATVAPIAAPLTGAASAPSAADGIASTAAGANARLGATAGASHDTSTVFTAGSVQAGGGQELGLHWSASGEAELSRIPFFVRGKVRRNTEAYARDRGVSTITEEVLYDAKAHFSR
jgi:light-independent protochlorophyllide reductase subunit B